MSICYLDLIFCIVYIDVKSQYSYIRALGMTHNNKAFPPKWD